jgi:hypothetical protein
MKMLFAAAHESADDTLAQQTLGASLLCQMPPQPRAHTWRVPQKFCARLPEICMKLVFL